MTEPRDDRTEDPLAKLRDHFDEMVRKMQTPEARAAVDALFRATPEELGRSAVLAAKKRDAPK